MDGFSLQRLSVYCKRDAGTGFRILGVQGQSLGKPPGPSPLLYHQASEAQQSELTQAVLTVELLLKMHGYLPYTKVPLWHFKIRDLESEHCCASCLTPVFPNIFQQNKHLFITLFNCISVKYLIKKENPPRITCVQYFTLNDDCGPWGGGVYFRTSLPQVVSWTLDCSQQAILGQWKGFLQGSQHRLCVVSKL